MKKSKIMAAAFALAFVTACGRWERKSVDNGRMDSAYRAAMYDFRSGRIDAAIKGFRQAIQENPANTSARFQLACVLQDSKRDYLGAYCSYQEYLLQQPGSDKARLAKDRLAACEKEMAKELSKKYNLNENEALMQELTAAQARIKEDASRAAAAAKEAETLRGRLEALVAERSRLTKIIKSMESGEAETQTPKVMEARDLLDMNDDADNRRDLAAEAAALRSEESAEATLGSLLLPAQTAEDVAKRDAAEKAKKDREMSELKTKEKVAASRPKTYMVQEGDTLYVIARRFYGRMSAWKLIRDANKAVISADGRVRAGDTINLPETEE